MGSHRFQILNYVSVFLVSFALVTFSGCDKDDPKPVNDQEVITTLQITLVPDGGGSPVTLKFFDADGEQGSTAPVITVSGPLSASTLYPGIIELKNETTNPVGNIAEEVAEEGHDHLFCFEAASDLVTVAYEDEDSNGLPLGLITSWQVGAAGTTTVTVSLRHQAGTKTGECPGSGETDVQVTFNVQIV